MSMKTVCDIQLKGALHPFEPRDSVLAVNDFGDALIAYNGHFASL